MKVSTMCYNLQILRFYLVRQNASNVLQRTTIMIAMSYDIGIIIINVTSCIQTISFMECYSVGIPIDNLEVKTV